MPKGAGVCVCVCVCVRVSVSGNGTIMKICRLLVLKDSAVYCCISSLVSVSWRQVEFMCLRARAVRKDAGLGCLRARVCICVSVGVYVCYKS